MALITTLIIGFYALVIITSLHLTMGPVRHKLSELQAITNAYSGLNLAQAFVGGLDGQKIDWETQELKQSCDDKGSFIVSSKHVAGWLKVVSTGIYLRDTITLAGILGQQPPAVTANALNLTSQGTSVIIGDRANVQGNIGLTGGVVTTKGVGIFKGVQKKIVHLLFNDTILSGDLEQAWGKNKGSYISDSLYSKTPEHLDNYVIDAQGGINKTVVLVSDTTDGKGTTVYIQGDLIVKNDACLRNVTCYIKRNLVIKDNATIDNCSLISLGNATIGDRARVCGNVICIDSLIIKNNARFVYPSFVYLASTVSHKQNNNAVVIIEDNAWISGIISTATPADSTQRPQLTIVGHAKIEGFVLCPGSITCFGNVKGSIYANRISYMLKGGIYDNWLRDVSITSSNYSGAPIPLLFPKEGNPKYLKVERLARNLR